MPFATTSGRGRRYDRRQLIAAASIALTTSAWASRTTPARQTKPGFSNSAGDAGLANLLDFLRFIPATVFDDPELQGFIWTYADFATQLAALDVEMPDRLDDLPEGYLNATYPLAYGSSVYSYALDEEFVAAIGFLPLSVHSTLHAGAPPAQISLFRGGIDLDALSATWTASGYSEVESGDVTYWNLADDDSLDLENPIQRRVMSAFNNLAILDGVVVAAGTIATMEQVVATWTGTEESLAQHEATQRALTGMPDDTVSIAGVNPVTFYAVSVPPESVIADSDEAVGPMPALDAIVTGITAGFHAVSGDGLGPSATPAVGLADSRVVTRLVAASADDAAAAAAVAEYRWTTAASVRTGELLNELMPLESSTNDDDVAVIQFRIARSQRSWLEIFLVDDAFAFAPS